MRHICPDAADMCDYCERRAEDTHDGVYDSEPNEAAILNRAGL
jgi:hypothetical protein